MTAPLTLPGTIPGLLRVCSPVVQTFNGGRRCVVSELGGGTVPMARIGGQWFKLSELALDLSDPTGRFHVLHWLASRDVAAVNDIADDMTGPIVGALYWAWLGWEDDTGAPLGWELNLWTARHFFLDNDLFEDLNHREVGVLSDGSRWVDAEALRRIVLHVAGLEVPA